MLKEEEEAFAPPASPGNSLLNGEDNIEDETDGEEIENTDNKSNSASPQSTSNNASVSNEGKNAEEESSPGSSVSNYAKNPKTVRKSPRSNDPVLNDGKNPQTVRKSPRSNLRGSNDGKNPKTIRKSARSNVSEVSSTQDPHVSSSPSSYDNAKGGRLLVHNHLAPQHITGRKPLGSSTKPGKLKTFSEKYLKTITPVLFVVVSIIVYVVYGVYNKMDGSEVLSPYKFLDIVKEKYPSQIIKEFDVFVDQIVYARKCVTTSTQSVPYLLLHHNNHKVANDIARQMAKFAASFFNNSTEIFDLDALDMEENYFPDKLGFVKDQTDRTGTLFVTNFDKLSTNNVQFFHAICDKYPPFTKKPALYILVLNTLDNNILKKDKHSEWKNCAVSTMKYIWSDLHEEYLSPLITRLTENVLKINP